MVQVGIQAIFYLHFVNKTVRAYGLEAQTSISFSDIRFSIGISILSLAVGKFKVTGAPPLCLRKVRAHFPNKMILSSLLYHIRSVFMLVLQANELNAEYCSSTSQKLIYFLAAVGG